MNKKYLILLCILTIQCEEEPMAQEPMAQEINERPQRNITMEKIENTTDTLLRMIVIFAAAGSLYNRLVAYSILTEMNPASYTQLILTLCDPIVLMYVGYLAYRQVVFEESKDITKEAS